MVAIPKRRLTGRALTVMVGAARHTPAKRLIAQVFREQLGMNALRQLTQEATGPLPASFAPIAARPARNIAPYDFGPPPKAAAPWGALEIARRFAASDISPTHLTERTIETAYALGRDEPSSNPFCVIDEKQARHAAQASSERYANGQSLGLLDGIIVPIKEEMHARGLPTRLGTRSIANVPSRVDSTVVARLRAAGAIVSFQTAMTEYGLSPLGGNMFRAMPRNPYNRAHLAGGSSTGSAVSVAIGMSPLALGCDGGGSIRVPAAFTGLFGLKPSFGRIPMTGHGMRSGNSVTAVGPIASSSHDLALFVEATAGADPEDVISRSQPELEPGELLRALGRGVRGLRIGIDEDQWSLSPENATRKAREALEALAKEGATLVSVSSRLAQHAPAIGYLTLAIEAVAALLEERDHLDEMSPDVQLLVSVVTGFEADDYVLAQRLRGALRREAIGLFADIDLLALPSVGGPPPKVSELEEAMGFVDPVALDEVSRYVYVASLCGLPAGTAPVGFDDQGLPLGLQIIGDAWDEASVLQTLAHLERIGVSEVKRPPAHQDLLRAPG